MFPPGKVPHGTLVSSFKPSAFISSHQECLVSLGFELNKVMWSVRKFVYQRFRTPFKSSFQMLFQYWMFQMPFLVNSWCELWIIKTLESVRLIEYSGDMNNKLLVVRYSDVSCTNGCLVFKGIQIPDHLAIRQLWPFKYQTSPVYRSPL